jgi:hypothetical protein
MMFTVEQQKMLETIANLPDQLEALVANLNEEQLKTPYVEDEWSIQQIVHHIADSHMNSFIRLKLILTEDNPPLKPYIEPLWAKTADVSDVPIAASLQLLRGLHQRWVVLFQSLDEEMLHRTGFHSELKQDISPLDLLQIYSGHCTAHLDQIQRTMAAAN